MNKLVFKIARAAEWSAAQAAGQYFGSPDDLRDGFIHLSAAPQVSGTLEKYFRAERDLVLVAFNADALGSALRWETSRNGEAFPHCYAPLPVVAAQWARPILQDEKGNNVIKEASLAC